MANVKNFFAKNWGKMVSFAAGVALALLGKISWIDVVGFLN